MANVLLAASSSASTSLKTARIALSVNGIPRRLIFLLRGASKENYAVHESMPHELDLGEYTARQEARQQGLIRSIGGVVQTLAAYGAYCARIYQAAAW